MNPTNEKSDPTKDKSEVKKSEKVSDKQKSPKVMIIEGKNEEINSSKIGDNEKKGEEKELERKTGLDLKLSADDIIERDFTPEQRRLWTELMMGSTLSPKSSNESDSTELSSGSPKPSTSSFQTFVEKELDKSEKEKFNESEKVNKTFNKSDSKAMVEKFMKKLDKDEEREKLLIKSESDAIKSQSLCEMSDRKWTPILRFGSRIFPQEIRNKSKRPKSYITSKVPNKTKQRAQKYLSKLESQQLKLGKFITLGTYGYVVEGSHLDQKKIAVKIIDLTVSGKRVVDGDVNIWGQLRHDYIINLMHSVTETDVLFLVMPLAEKDLFVEIYDNGAVSEQKGRDLIKQILSGLKYMHEKGFAHRDVKLENILIVGQKLKICDFDQTIKCVDENGKPIENNERRGTLEYMAPEVISGEGSIDLRLTDVWSCGILLFALLTYTYAFGPILRIRKNSQKVIENMKFSRYSYPKKCLPSNECQSFISQLLQFDQYSRLTVNQLMDSNWFGLNLTDSNDRTIPPQITRSLSFASPLTSTSSFNTSSLDSSSSSSYDTE